MILFTGKSVERLVVLEETVMGLQVIFIVCRIGICVMDSSGGWSRSSNNFWTASAVRRESSLGEFCEESWSSSLAWGTGEKSVCRLEREERSLEWCRWDGEAQERLCLLADRRGEAQRQWKSELRQRSVEEQEGQRGPRRQPRVPRHAKSFLA